MREISANSRRREPGHLRVRNALRKSRTADGESRATGTVTARDRPTVEERRTPDRVVASEIVHRAASILEEEIAAGIVAAKEIESRFVKHDGVSDSAPQEIIERFRKDAHEMTDVIMDLLSAITKNLGMLADHLAKTNGGGNGNSAAPAGSAGGGKARARRKSNGGDNHRGRHRLPGRGE